MDDVEKEKMSKKPTEPELELSNLDSFILDTLRGWRLLQAAALNDDEKRDMLSTTQNKLDYQSISDAAQTLWDDQSSGTKQRSWNNNNKMEIEDDWPRTDHGSNAGSDWDTSSTGSWGYSNWASPYWDGNYNDWDNWGGSYNNFWAGWGYEDQLQQPAMVPRNPAELEADAKEAAKVMEYEKAEAAASSMANEAMRTLQEARQQTALARRDRGFGAHEPQRGPYWNCGGPHLAAECPDDRIRRMKGGGKGMNMMDG